LLISANVGALSRLAGAELLRAGAGKLLGLREQCGFEPLLLVQHAVLAMPFTDGQSEGTDFALIALTTVDADQGLQCAQLVIKKRGGTPGWSKSAGFGHVRDLDKPSGVVAMRNDGMFVLSGGQYFRAVMDMASGMAAADPTAKLRTELHRQIRGRVEPGELVISLLPDDSLPLPGVQALGLSLKIRREVELLGFVACASAPACAEALQLLEATRAGLAAEPGLSGLGAATITERSGGLEIAGRLPRQQLAALLEQLLAP
jgi:hypothetical protein